MKRRWIFDDDMLNATCKFANDDFNFQTLNTIGNEKNTTIIFPVPIDVMSHFLPNLGFDKNNKTSNIKKKNAKKLAKRVSSSSSDEVIKKQDEFGELQFAEIEGE